MMENNRIELSLHNLFSESCYEYGDNYEDEGTEAVNGVENNEGDEIQSILNKLENKEFIPKGTLTTEEEMILIDSGEYEFTINCDIIAKNVKISKYIVDSNDKIGYNMYKDVKKSKNWEKKQRLKEEYNMNGINKEMIKRLYKANGMTQKDLAEKLGISERSVNRKLSKDGEFTAIEIIMLMQIFEIDADTLIK